MSRAAPNSSHQPLIVLAGVAFLVAALYWARAVVLPVALSVLLTFLLSPVVRQIQRRGLGRTPAVLLVALVAFSLLGIVCWVVSVQVSGLSEDISEYEGNLQHKLSDLRHAGKGGLLEKLQSTFQKATSETEKEEPAPEIEPKEKPIRVIVVSDHSTLALWQLMPAAGPLLLPITTAGVVILLVIYMLIRREDLRNRLIQLAGTGQVPLTTRAMDEAGQRISSYLLIKSLTNGGFGIILGLGLFLIGVPHATLWGFLAALLRFIPSLGTWLAAIGPVLLSVVVFEGWAPVFLVLGLFVVLEVVTANALEPRFYGARVGVAPVALFLSLLFWTWLWGPVGLILATPLTVCLAVLGKHVPQLEFLGVLLSDQPALDPDIGYYQRLLARDQDEAADIAEEQRRTFSLEQVYDELLIPALTYAKSDLESGKLAADDARFVLQATREIVEELGIVEQKLAKPEEAHVECPDGPSARPKVQIVACPARDESDEAALLMLRQLLDPAVCAIELTASATLVSEVISLVEQKRPALICIAALSPGGLSHTRLLCKRLRARFPELKIVVGRWGLKTNLDKNRDQLLEAGADQFAATLKETRGQLGQLIQFLAHAEAVGR